MSVTPYKNTDQLRQETPQGGTQRKIIIAVDGPAASGKGTLARQIAKRLGYAYLDTGALYRAVALATLELNGDPSKIQDVAPAVEIVKRHLTPELLESPLLRSYAVSEAASQIAALPEVRLELLEYQRNFAKNPPGNVGGAVLDGRDIGTVICPDADIKFFVTAEAEERAHRRFKELQRSHPEMTPKKVLSDLLQRDRRDTARKTAPGVAAADAYLLDTTGMSPEAALEAAVGIMREKFLVESA